MRDFILFCGMIMVFTSCENLVIKDLELDETGFEKQIVLQSFLNAGSDSVVVLVSENESVLSEVRDIKYLPNIDLRLLHEGNEMAKLEQREDGLYEARLGAPLSTIGQYELRATNTPYDDVSARTELPSNVGVSDVQFIYDVGTDALDMSQVSELSFVIDDQPGKDYYTIRINNIVEDVDTFIIAPGDTIFEERFVYIYPSTTQLDPSISTTGFNGDLVINDEIFDGKRKEVKVRFSFSLWSSNGQYEEEFRQKLNFDLVTHSEASFNYLISRNAYDEASDFALFSEPVSVFTNIENGLGIFGGRSSATYFVE